MLVVGSQIRYGGKFWTVSAVGFIGERYYWLTRQNEIAMIPACILEKD